MSARSPVLRLFALLGATLAACTSVAVAPEPDLERVVAASRRPDLGFSLAQCKDGSLANPDYDVPEEPGLDGENLAMASAAFREALVETGAFGAITRTSAGTGLHCAFELRTCVGIVGGGVPFALTVGVIPDCGYDEWELVATVTGPGRAPSTYRARTSSSTFLWLPCLPIAIVQAFTQRGGFQETVDSIATQMANDGWLGR